jgi:putative flippase GtrA
MAIDVALLVTLVEAFRWHYLAAASVSFAAGALVAYALVTRFVFSYRRIKDTRIEFAVFAGVGLVGLVVNGTTMHLVVERLELGYLAGKGVAASLTFMVNFVARRGLLFTRWSSVQLTGSDN